MTSTSHDRTADDRVLDHAAVRETATLSVPASADELASVRRWARHFLEERGATGVMVDDIELAVSELATNVIRHTASDTIRLRIARSNRSWILDVGDADDAPAPASAQLPPADDPTGRGLFVVKSLMDRVEVVTVDGATVIRCTRADSS